MVESQGSPACLFPSGSFLNCRDPCIGRDQQGYGKPHRKPGDSNEAAGDFSQGKIPGKVPVRLLLLERRISLKLDHHFDRPKILVSWPR
jgi:hypothetical protein